MAKKIKNFKGEDLVELKKKLENLREDLRMKHFKTEGAKSKNVKEMSMIKKQIAQILTEINKNNTKN